MRPTQRVRPASDGIHALLALELAARLVTAARRARLGFFAVAVDAAVVRFLATGALLLRCDRAAAFGGEALAFVPALRPRDALRDVFILLAIVLVLPASMSVGCLLTVAGLAANAKSIVRSKGDVRTSQDSRCSVEVRPEPRRRTTGTVFQLVDLPPSGLRKARNPFGYRGLSR